MQTRRVPCRLRSAERRGSETVRPHRRIGHRRAAVGAGRAGLREVALQLRLLLGCGTSLEIATVVAACGAVVRRPGTVLVVTEAGKAHRVQPRRTAGWGHRGPGRRGAGDRAGQARAPADRGGRRRLHRPVRRDQPGGPRDACARAWVPCLAAALRYLDSGAAAVLIMGTGGVAGYAVAGAGRVTGRPGRSSLPPMVRMHGACRAAARRHPEPMARRPEKRASASASGWCPVRRRELGAERSQTRCACMPRVSPGNWPRAGTAAQRQGSPARPRPTGAAAPRGLHCQRIKGSRPSGQMRADDRHGQRRPGPALKGERHEHDAHNDLHGVRYP
jgi:hypothetical protein